MRERGRKKRDIGRERERERESERARARERERERDPRQHKSMPPAIASILVILFPRLSRKHAASKKRSSEIKTVTSTPEERQAGRTAPVFLPGSDGSFMFS